MSSAPKELAQSAAAKRSKRGARAASSLRHQASIAAASPAIRGAHSPKRSGDPSERTYATWME